MRTTTIHIYFEDHARRIGTGWRTCELRVGRRWAHIKECATGASARLPVALFQTLKHREIKVRKRFLSRP